MMVLIFGLNTIATAFILWTFFFLSWERLHQKGWQRDVYFWLVTGTFWVSLGLLWFSGVRTIQGLVVEDVLFVQPPIAAVSVAAIIFLGLSCKIRAIALNRPRAGWWFLGIAAAWALFSAFR